jgi:hypothetical protein
MFNNVHSHHCCWHKWWFLDRQIFLFKQIVASIHIGSKLNWHKCGYGLITCLLCWRFYIYKHTTGCIPLKIIHKLPYIQRGCVYLPQSVILVWFRIIKSALKEPSLSPPLSGSAVANMPHDGRLLWPTGKTGQRAWVDSWLIFHVVALHFVTCHAPPLHELPSLVSNVGVAPPTRVVFLLVVFSLICQNLS